MAFGGAHARPGVRPATGGKAVNLSRPSYEASPRRNLFLVPLLLLALSGSLLAAPAPAPQAPSPPQQVDRVDDEVEKAIQVLMILSMKKALELTREQEMEVIPKVQRILEERERFTRQRQEALRRVEAKLRLESVPDQEFREAVLRLDQMENQHREMEVRLRIEIDRHLNSRQQAGLRIFVPQFRRQVQSQVDEARRLILRDPRLPVPPVLPAPEEEYYSDDEEF